MSSLLWSAACIAPQCRAPAVRADGKFCAVHDLATPTKKGGWISADKRRRDLVHIDASQISPRLWVGSKPRPDLDLPKIDLIVLCAQEIQPPQMAFHGRVLRCPLPDAQLSRVQLQHAVTASGIVAKALVNDGQRVLVTCAMGLNRSAFVAALALGRVTEMSADKIIEVIRARRDRQCLFNEHFVAHLRTLIGGGRQQIRGRDRRRLPI